MSDVADDTAMHEAWEFYWRTNVPVAEIAATYGIGKSAAGSGAVAEAVGPCFYNDLRCVECKTTLSFKTRSERDAYWRRHDYEDDGLVCTLCEEKQAVALAKFRQEQQAAERQKRRAAAQAAEDAEHDRMDAKLQAMLPRWSAR